VRVYPTCERVGSFRVRAHAGVNKIRWRGRLQGRPLAQGTYRVLVRARGAGRDAAALKIVVVRGEPLSARELRRARSANVCGTVDTAARNAAATTSGVGPTSSPSSGATSNPTSSAVESVLIGGAGTIGRGARSLGAQFKKAVEDPRSVHPLVWIALGFSILLLAVAAAPSEALVNARAGAIAYKRVEVALVGTAALCAAVLMYLIS
jgi:hypothetical protein